MSVWYLDLDDEITDAVARLRAAQDDRVVLVLPPGSRIGTGRINFRLLAREAETRHLSIALVSGDHQVRAMATAAGLPAFTSVSLAEAALDPAMQAAARAAAAEAGEAAQAVGSAAAAGVNAGGIAVAGPALISTAPGPGGGVGSQRQPGFAARLRGRGRAAGAPSKTYAMTPRAASAALTGEGAVSADTGAYSREPARTRSGVTRRRRAAGWGVRLTALGGLIVAGSYVAYLVLPNASITLTPFTTMLDPLRLAITASKDVGVPDAAARLVPAEVVTIDLSSVVTQPATGIFHDDEQATGVVRFFSANTTVEVSVEAGTHVETASGVTFETIGQVTVPKARIDEGRGQVDVGIRAVKAGTDGNVPADTIIRIPSGTLRNALAPEGGVTNPKRTDGGKEDELPKVLERDYRDAQRAIVADLQRQLDDALAKPGTAPRGLTHFPATADLGTPFYPTRLADLEDVHDPTFELTASTTASVLAVDEGLVRTTAGVALAATVPGTRVYLDAAVADVSQGAVVGDTIVYDVTIRAPSYKALDEVAIKESIKGRPVLEAQSILDRLGRAEVSVWPDFLPNLPDDVRRIDLTIEEPQVTPP